VKTRQDVAQKIIDELAIHTEIEEESFLPCRQALIPRHRQ
jgi:hypothetical protein